VITYRNQDILTQCNGTATGLQLGSQKEMRRASSILRTKRPLDYQQNKDILNMEGLGRFNTQASFHREHYPPKQRNKSWNKLRKQRLQ
jgi:hypothetical protein